MAAHMIPSRMAAFRSARRGKPGVSRFLFRCFMGLAVVGVICSSARTRCGTERVFVFRVRPKWRVASTAEPFFHGNPAAHGRRFRRVLRGVKRDNPLMGWVEIVSVFHGLSQVGVRESAPFTALAPRRSSRNGVGRSRLAPSSCGADNQEGEKEGDDGGATDRLSA